MTSKWIWYYGDFEIYHSLKVQTRREEYDYYFPPFWKLDDCWHNVNFTKEVELESPAEMTVYAHGNGHVEIDGRLNSYKIGKAITVPAGKHKIIVQVANVYGLPCIYSDSDAILTDESWKVSCYGEELVNAGCNDYYTDKNDNPQEFKFCYEEIIPVSKKKTDNGMLYDFGRETFAKLCFDRQDGKIDIFYGESEAEALDTENTVSRRIMSICRWKIKAHSNAVMNY